MVILALGPAATVKADCVIDHFDDGNNDGWVGCGNWDEQQAPLWDASSGEYCLGLAEAVKRPPPPPININSEWLKSSDDPYYSEGCLRASFRTGTTADETWTTHFALATRSDCKGAGYLALLGPYLGRVSIFRTGALLANEFGHTFEEGREYIAEMCAVGTELSLKYWAVGDAEPGKPQLTASDSTYRHGRLGVAVFIENDNRGRFVAGCFDNVSFIPSPVCRADFDCSGDVVLPDVRAVLSAWGRYAPCPAFRVEDIDEDCAVGFGDLMAVVSAWGSCT